MREKEFGTDDGVIVGGILWRDEPEFGSTDGIWRLADVEGAITNFMESENLIKSGHLTYADCQRSRTTHLVASQSLWTTSKVVCKKVGGQGKGYKEKTQERGNNNSVKTCTNHLCIMKLPRGQLPQALY